MQKLFPLIVINFIPLLLCTIYCSEIWNAIQNKENYPFGSEWGQYSIYKSQQLYASYFLLATIVNVSLIIASIYSKWRIYFILLPICILMVFYPMLTN